MGRRASAPGRLARRCSPDDPRVHDDRPAVQGNPPCGGSSAMPGDVECRPGNQAQQPMRTAEER